MKIDTSRIIMGCGNFGGIGSNPLYYGKGDDPAQATKLLDLAREIGISRFDTANTYGGGLSEKTLGNWFKNQASSFQSKASIYTKVGNPFGCSTQRNPLDRREVTLQLDQSLTRLGIDCIDTYFLHEMDPKTRQDETLEALSRAIEQGKINFFGISNVKISDVIEWQKRLDSLLRARFHAVQNEYNYLLQHDKIELIPYLQRSRLHYFAFSPLAGGILSDRYMINDGMPMSSRYHRMPEFFAKYKQDHAKQLTRQLQIEALNQGYSMAETALRFILDTPGVDAVIIAPRKREHYESFGFKCS